eukprot:409886_1
MYFIAFILVIMALLYLVNDKQRYFNFCVPILFLSLIVMFYCLFIPDSSYKYMGKLFLMFGTTLCVFNIVGCIRCTGKIQTHYIYKYFTPFVIFYIVYGFGYPIIDGKISNVILLVIIKGTLCLLCAFAWAVICDICEESNQAHSIDNKITKYIFASFEKQLFEYDYKFKNGPVPPSVYLQHYHDENIFDCAICLDSFGKTSQTILRCGHRFHSKCLRIEELRHYNNHPYLYPLYICPMCALQLYDHTEKWDYKPINNHMFQQIQNDTLLNVLPNDIQNIIIDYV